MPSVRNLRENFKSFVRSLPVSFVVSVIMCLVGVSAFSIGWIARGNADNFEIQKTRITLPAAVGSVSKETGGRGVQPNGLFVGSKNADHYHYRWCPGAGRIHDENKVYFASENEARQAGYEPAGNCPGLK